MKLEDIKLSEVSQPQKDTDSTIFYRETKEVVLKR